MRALLSSLTFGSDYVKTWHKEGRRSAQRKRLNIPRHSLLAFMLERCGKDAPPQPLLVIIFMFLGVMCCSCSWFKSATAVDMLSDQEAFG